MGQPIFLSRNKRILKSITNQNIHKIPNRGGFEASPGLLFVNPNLIVKSHKIPNFFVRFLLLTLYNIQKIRYNRTIKILEVSL